MRRLGVPTDASVEAIELAWRGAAPAPPPRRRRADEGLELAKRINVAHDWLSDPALRARYDRERGLRHAVGPRGDGHGGRGTRAVQRPPAPAQRAAPAQPAAALVRTTRRGHPAGSSNGSRR